MKTINIKYLNNKLKEIRNQRKLYQKDVAKSLDMQCEDRLCRWEQGLSAPNITNLARLANIYGVLPHVFYPELFADLQPSPLSQESNRPMD